MALMIGLVIFGFFCTYCSIKNYDWFIENIITRPFLNVFGRQATRIFYFGFGPLLLLLIILMYLDGAL